MWEAIEPSEWSQTPCLKGRAATEKDIENGVAVFAIPSGSEAHNIDLPVCVILIDEESGDRTPAIAIQAESADNGVLLGVRYIEGGNGVCTISEVGEKVSGTLLIQSFPTSRALIWFLTPFLRNTNSA